MNVTCAEIAAWSGAKLVGVGDVSVRGVSTDTRTLRPGELYVALRGERFDGHDFVGEAVSRGAPGVVVSRTCAPASGVAVLEVEDTERALGAIARAYRRTFRGPVVAITGSNGKTTTKELCAAVLAAAGRRVRRSEGNLNNQVGLPLSILRLEDDDEALVVELGMNHPGEIDALAGISEPTVGAITQVAHAHLEGLGSLDGVARAKGELLDRLPDGGTAVLNADDPNVARQAERFRGRVLWFGSAERADFRARDVSVTQEGTGFRLATPAGEVEVRMAVPARYVATLATCAVGCAFATGLLPDDATDAVRAGLESFAAVPGRLALRRHPSGARVLDDTYNANPASVRAALEALHDVAGAGRTIAVLGDMLELGEAEKELHAEAGREAARFGVTVLIAVGPRSRQTAAAAREAGVGDVRTADDALEAAGILTDLLRPDDTVLVKGSRGMRMEGVLGSGVDR